MGRRWRTCDQPFIVHRLRGVWESKLFRTKRISIFGKLRNKGSRNRENFFFAAGPFCLGLNAIRFWFRPYSLPAVSRAVQDFLYSPRSDGDVDYGRVPEELRRHS